MLALAQTPASLTTPIVWHDQQRARARDRGTERPSEVVAAAFAAAVVFISCCAHAADPAITSRARASRTCSRTCWQPRNTCIEHTDILPHNNTEWIGLVAPQNGLIAHFTHS